MLVPGGGAKSNFQPSAWQKTLGHAGALQSVTCTAWIIVAAVAHKSKDVEQQ